MEKRLIVICEGAEHTVAYLHANGVYPTSAILSSVSLKEFMPYLQDNDEVLLIIKGLTDFTLAEAYSMVTDLANVEQRVLSVRVMSNVNLGVTALPYFYYEGDLFYGLVRKSIMGKLSDYLLNTEGYLLEDDSSNEENNGKNGKSSSKINQYGKINSVMTRYKVYNQSDVVTQLLRPSTEPVSSLEYTLSDKRLVESIISVDAFGEN